LSGLEAGQERIDVALCLRLAEVESVLKPPDELSVSRTLRKELPQLRARAVDREVFRRSEVQRDHLAVDDAPVDTARMKRVDALSHLLALCRRWSRPVTWARTGSGSRVCQVPLGGCSRRIRMLRA